MGFLKCDNVPLALGCNLKKTLLYFFTLPGVVLRATMVLLRVAVLPL